MNYEIVPDNKKIGGYTLLIRDNFNYLSLIEILSENTDITSLMSVDDISEYNIPKNIILTTVTLDDLNKFRLSISIPEWVKSEENFTKIVQGDYGSIKPQTAEFVTTLNCNFRCLQCSYAQPKKNKKLWIETKEDKIIFNSNFKNSEFNMDESIVYKAIDSLNDSGINNIVFTGGGEPLVNATVTLKGMRYAKSKNMSVGLYTNGSLMTDEIIDELIDISPLFIRISLYGATKEDFTKYTRQNAKVFDIVLSNINNLLSKVNRKKSNITIGISYLIHPITVEGLKYFSDNFFAKVSLDNVDRINYIRFTPAVDYFDNNQHSEEFILDCFDYVNNHIKESFSKTKVNIVPFYHRVNDLYEEKRYNHCGACGWYTEVGPSGDLYICCEKLFIDDYKIGNIANNTIDQIYSSPQRLKVLNKINSEKCKNCPPVCKPHELNKIFNQIEIFIDNNQLNKVINWREALLGLQKDNYEFVPGFNAFES